MGEEAAEAAARTPAEQLRDLLARVDNPFDVSDAVLARLETAVLSRVELHGWRHRKTPPGLRCSSYRHLFLLADGSCLPLYELRCASPDGGGPARHEVYDSVEALRLSARRARDHGEARGEADSGAGGTLDGAGAAVPGVPEGPPPEPPSGSLAVATGLPFRQEDRRYAHGDSPRHARRLLDRAENADRPGGEVLRLLDGARGHEILPAARPRALSGERQVWCAVYEHAFLLADGRELSLYELEHDLCGSGDLVCEVYLEEAVADRAVHERARERGLDV